MIDKRLDSMVAELSRVYGELTAAQLERDRLAAETAWQRAELDIIANATPSQWEPDMRDQFQAWAQNRARQAAATPQPAEAVTGGVWRTEPPPGGGGGSVMSDAIERAREMVGDARAWLLEKTRVYGPESSVAPEEALRILALSDAGLALREACCHPEGVADMCRCHGCTAARAFDAEIARVIGGEPTP